MRLRNKILNFLLDAVRPLLGPRHVCIYPTSCTLYAKVTMQKKPLIFAIPLIILRVLSCNPITAVYLRIKNRRSDRLN